MKILVTTSNKYLHLLVPYATLFNKYWPNQELVFLGFDNPNIPDLPDNCEYVSLGKQEDFGPYWTDPILSYVKKLKEEYFVITCEDCILCDYVDIEEANLLESEVLLGNADKAMLDSHLNFNIKFRSMARPHKEGILKLDQHAQYRTSLAPAIWRKDYFLKYCKPNMTSWDFEVKNMPESQRDGATIISLDQDEWLFKYCNVYRKGKPWPHHGSIENGKSLIWGATSGIKKEDILFIFKYLPDDVQQNNEKFLCALEDETIHH